ncbi:hypothetical protein AB1L42_21670 [Thalassoglobus sp. JC818]|uniref:hypothetical protein n=1 Tax=Thalassoglobus sp. JC818 TaxID=3232136 RepID=UPI0034580DD9
MPESQDSTETPVAISQPMETTIFEAQFESRMANGRIVIDTTARQSASAINVVGCEDTQPFIQFQWKAQAAQT